MTYVTTPQQAGPSGRIPKGALGLVGAFSIPSWALSCFSVLHRRRIRAHRRYPLRPVQCRCQAGSAFPHPLRQWLGGVPNLQRVQKDHLNTYTVDNQELDVLVTLNYRLARGRRSPHLHHQPRLSRQS